MKNAIRATIFLIAVSAGAAYADPFSEGRNVVEFTLTRPGAEELLLRVFPDIDTSLECLAVGSSALALYAKDQLPQDNAIAYGYLLALSMQAADKYRLAMRIDSNTFLALSNAAGQRARANPGRNIPRCVSITSEFADGINSLPSK